MQQMFEQPRRDLEEMIEQRDDLLLLALCSEDDYGFALQLLRDIEQVNGSDLFLLYADPFRDRKSFVQGVVDRLQAEHRLACQALGEQGKPPLPEMPRALLDAGRPDIERLKQALVFARSLLPREGDHRLIWGMFPMEVADWPAYLGLVSELVPWKGVEPWMGRVRIICRCPRDLAERSPRLLKAPRVRTATISLAPADINSSLERQADDQDLPLEERIQALLSLAVMDYGHGRLDDAAAKYDVVLAHYQQTGDRAMQAFAMNGLGDVEKRRGDLDRALHWYECAVPPAGEAKHPVVLASIVRNLGDVAYAKKEYAQAEKYYDQLDQLTQATLDAECKARALEWRGLSQEQQKAYDRAVLSWEVAVDLCAKIGMPAPQKACLEHLVRVYKLQKNREGLAKAEARLEALQKEKG